MEVHKDFFVHAASEVANGRVDQTLFIKALALADGDEKKARAIYIKLRAEELQKESRSERVARTASVAVGLATGTVVAAGVVATQVAKSRGFTDFVNAISSLLIPGTGQFQEGRRVAGTTFLVAWIAVIGIGIALLVHGQLNSEAEAQERVVAADAYLEQVGCFSDEDRMRDLDRCIDYVRTARAIESSPEMSGKGKTRFYALISCLIILVFLHGYSLIELVEKRAARRRSSPQAP